MSGGTAAPIRLLVVDDHPVVRDGVRGMFAGHPDFEVVADAVDGAQAVASTMALDPDVVLMDLRMPGTDGVSAIRDLVQRGARARVLVLTTYDTDRDVLAALDAGAIGYILKDAPREELFRAVRAAARGETVLSPTVAGQLIGRMREPPSPLLTPRELGILRLIADGATNRVVARTLFISEATVKTHLLHAYGKLGVRDRAAAVAAAYQRGLFDDPDDP